MFQAILWIFGLIIILWFASIVWIAFDPATHAKPSKRNGARKKPFIIPKRGLKIPAQIVYAGGKTPGARRDILINSIEDSFEAETRRPTKIVSAFCMMAGETRHFRVDRITELIDAQTGEIVTDAGEWIAATITERLRGRRVENAARARQRRLDRKEQP